MTVSLAACGGDGRTDEDESKAAAGDSFVYVPEYVSLGGDDNRSLSNAIYADGKLYYSCYIWDEENGVSRQPLVKYDIAAGSQEELNLEGTEMSGACVSQMSADKNVNLYAVWVRSVWDENNQENWQ